MEEEEEEAEEEEIFSILNIRMSRTPDETVTVTGTATQSKIRKAVKRPGGTAAKTENDSGKV
jgi:hypothetical protein